jgi:hypothetical protein
VGSGKKSVLCSKSIFYAPVSVRQVEGLPWCLVHSGVDCEPRVFCPVVWSNKYVLCCFCSALARSHSAACSLLGLSRCTIVDCVKSEVCVGSLCVCVREREREVCVVVLCVRV